MKNASLAIVAALSLTMSAQTKPSIPDLVKNSFAKEFPNQKAKWSAEKGGFEAEFKLNGTEASAVYDKNGNRKELEVEIKTTELPANVIVYVKKNYPTAKITEASKITDDKNAVTYEAEIKKDGKSFDVLLDSTGKFIKINEKG